MSLAIHTDAPMMPLTQMIGTDATIEVGRAVAGGPDCIEGWAEPWSTPQCRQHHVIWGVDDETIYWVAMSLKTLGHTVVVTQPLTMDQFGDHEIVEDLPHAYTQTHEH